MWIWTDVSFQSARPYTKAESGHDFHEPNTASGERPIALFLDTVDLLTFYDLEQSDEKNRQGIYYGDHGLVIQTHIGTPVNPRNLARVYYDILNKLDLPKIRFHDLRHTHATILLKRGATSRSSRSDWATPPYRLPWTLLSCIN
ncbi:hypothetical protein PaeBR_01985 [Paenibacillus sp. BR2-3]|uniref:hypothetical protein n=1 Tax=Paenibacillus sp. BR2-3 TaxID=3048494 RepID=UPI0039778B62